MATSTILHISESWVTRQREKKREAPEVKGCTMVENTEMKFSEGTYT